MANAVVTFTLYTLISQYNVLEPLGKLVLLLVLLDCFLTLVPFKSMESFDATCAAFVDELIAQIQCRKSKQKKWSHAPLKFARSLLPLRVYRMDSYVQRGMSLHIVDSNINNVIFLLVK